MNEITKPINQEILLDEGYEKIAGYLQTLGLPTEGIIAPINERKSIANLIPQYISALPPDIKKDGKYLAKFVVGAGFGLFDYALNAVWNEVVLALYEKVKLYGIDIFYDAAIGGSLRSQYHDEKDLPAVKDNTLLNTCKKLELISEPIYMKLAHILDMRNGVGISHPTDYQVKAFELMGWLQTCVEEVIADRPSPSAIQVKGFIDNLKNHSTTLSETELATMIPHMQSLSTVHCASITRTIFGIYVSPDSNTTLRKNISLLAPHLWKLCKEETKYRFGIILEGYNNNLHREKYRLGEQFFEFCNASRYRSENEKSVILSELCRNLDSTHDSRDNFYHEVPIAEKIASFIDKESDIPGGVSDVLAKAVLKCRLGRGVTYCDGVSNGAMPFYNHILSVLGDGMAPFLIANTMHHEIRYKLTKGICLKHFNTVFSDLRNRIVSDRIREGIDYLLREIPKNTNCVHTEDFKQITATYINWN
ncbi:hypothetical protein [Pelagicoccus sp. SDUM812002]|uniref:hypothetical protein n=1 Tax=Pelagicoccus sp. SDUM812002 TaxID=3041266 RepID=UPI0028101954|nr:hypothetical protein [Pelagicoccus sp. SDUM812002]MDQ8188359.1 hypothetical protein [Pelagicoccus sp. SDUM812002]